MLSCRFSSFVFTLVTHLNLTLTWWNKHISVSYWYHQSEAEGNKSSSRCLGKPSFNDRRVLGPHSTLSSENGQVEWGEGGWFISELLLLSCPENRVFPLPLKQHPRIMFWPGFLLSDQAAEWAGEMQTHRLLASACDYSWAKLECIILEPL